MIVYMAYGYDDCGGCKMLKVYKNESTAKKFVDKCTKHAQKRPVKLMDETRHEYDGRLWKWKEQCPAGRDGISEAYAYESFEVEE